MAAGCILNAAGLEKFVHDAPLRDVEGKEVGLDQTASGGQGVFFNLEGVDGVIFAQRATIDPAIGKDEEVLRHIAGAFKGFVPG